LILDDLEGHRQPVRSAILATGGLLVSFMTCQFTELTIGLRRHAWRSG